MFNSGKSTSTTSPARARRSIAALSAVASGALVVSLLLGSAGAAHADTAPADPSNPATPPTVSADALSTTQIDGVAWSQVVVGNTVYVAGKFSTARPAGAAAGVNTVVRNNLLAYDLTTGVLIPTFAPSLNAQALAITASPDGSRIYVVGDFTSIDGAGYYRAAAFSTATGQIIPSFRPILESEGRAVTATNTSVYLGGTFSSVNGAARGFVARVNAADGSVDAWNPNADSTVQALALTPDGSRVVLGGRFAHIGGVANYGLGAVDTATGDVMPWAANLKVRDGGTKAAITALTATSDRIYGSGYVFGSLTDGNLEGSFSADPNSGAIQWIEDCHGDTYSVFASDTAVYVAGHPHYCANLGGYPDTNPRTHHQTIAFSRAATGTITKDPGGYFNWAGNPSPSLLDWFPTWVTGTVTGQGQAAWSVAGNNQYLVVGGEFPFVNGVAQAGLTRFAVQSIAPNKVGPNVSNALAPVATALSDGEVRVSWTATWDQDNKNLAYTVVRDEATANPVYRTSLDTTFWQRPQMGFVDRNLVPGSRHTYRVYATDAFGNSISRLGSTVTVASSTVPAAYSNAVAADSPRSYWPLDETSGAVGFDNVAFSDLTLGTGITRGATGIVPGDLASTFSGTSAGSGGTTVAAPAPNTFTTEAWIRTTSTAGGKIVGYGSTSTGLSGSYDRHLYLDNAGHVIFGVRGATSATLVSADRFNDGQWHQVAASLGSNGMRLYVDGNVVGSRTDVTAGQAFSGFWRVGGDNLSGWANRPTSNFLSGTIADVAVYPTVLIRQQVVNHLVASGRPSPIANTAPVASFTSSTSGLSATANGSGSFDADGSVASWAWNFGDGSTGAGSVVSHAYAAAGTYTITLTVTDDQGATNSTAAPVTVSVPVTPPGTVIAQADFGTAISNSWGAADVGGSWVNAGTASAYTVAGGVGQQAAPIGSTKISSLTSVNSSAADLTVSFGLDQLPTGGGSYISLIGRDVGSTNYQARTLVQASGAVQLQLLQGGTALQVVAVPGITFTPATSLSMRLEVSGTSPTTIRAKLWVTGTPEPATWQASVTDATAALQVAGYVGLRSYLSATATASPVTTSFDNFKATQL